MKRKYLIDSTQDKRMGERRASYQTFDMKTPAVQELINQALYILDSFGIPIEGKSSRQIERMAIAFLALCDVKTNSDWPSAKSLDNNYALKTRDVIDYVNSHFGESLSRGSYDDIRRKDLKHLALAGIVVSDRPEAAKNDPNRAWGINPEYVGLIRTSLQENWIVSVEEFFKLKPQLREQLSSQRDIHKTPIKLPSGTKLSFGPGQHNQLQKAIIEEFFPRYGFGANVIYVGDAAHKFLHYDEGMANGLGLAKLDHSELPDIVAYSAMKNWLYLVEAVHSSGPITTERIIALKPFLENCAADVIYITAFLNRSAFRKFVGEIAWETEVWIASEPDHLIHFNGNKFLGPYTR
ncbi:MAG: hypothetical protein KDE56_11520 [Anaerolineales bacterium]|nr:hypothetical protein [Anaerolineales bacterium]